MMYTLSNIKFIASMSDVTVEAIICNIFFMCCYMQLNRYNMTKCTVDIHIRCDQSTTA